MKDKNTEYMPDQRAHRNISFIKSGVRLVGYMALLCYAFEPTAIGWGALILAFAEVIGIAEELV